MFISKTAKVAALTALAIAAISLFGYTAYAHRLPAQPARYDINDLLTIEQAAQNGATEQRLLEMLHKIDLRFRGEFTGDL